VAITKTTEVSKIEVVGTWNVQVATDTVIKEDNIEISRSRHRHVLQPFSSKYVVESDDSKTWTHKVTDISGEDAQVQAIANAIWTDAVKASYKTWAENQGVL
jgi:Fe-S cluster biosynthesis and repair protein YggX